MEEEEAVKQGNQGRQAVEGERCTMLLRCSILPIEKEGKAAAVKADQP